MSRKKNVPILAALWLPPLGNGKVVYRALIVPHWVTIATNGSTITQDMYERIVTCYVAHSFEAPRLDENASVAAKEGAIQYLNAAIEERKKGYGWSDEDFESMVEILVDLRETAGHLVKRAVFTE